MSLKFIICFQAVTLLQKAVRNFFVQPLEPDIPDLPCTAILALDSASDLTIILD